ncbi:MAG TPA: glycerol-3-phosphate dehydrogenase [Roseiarcus sp.]|nr:glycerol-3-phosphate dehydrogenase [Roseiarcus sp.]
MKDIGQFDLIVVGGGVNGAGIARDAIGRGLSVFLCEKDDLAEGTSSRSSKLVHGGLRYLEYFEFRLVREALIEREVLLNMAPHIVRPMRFVLPHSPEQRPAWMIRLGLFLYDHLGGRKNLPPSRGVDLASAPEGQALRKTFRRAFEYSDCWVDDARLVALNALDLKRRGGTVKTRTPLVSARREAGFWTVELREGDVPATARGKALVNAAGPWVEDILARAHRHAGKGVRLIKGSHVITRKFWPGDHAYLLQNADKRVTFVIPYEGVFALIGTTDIIFHGAPEDVRMEAAEAEYLLASVNRYFDVALTPDDIVHAYSGVRPLFDDHAADPSAVTRDYVFDIDAPPGEAPLFTIFGGKITTYRKLAEHALQRLSTFFPHIGAPWTHRTPLPGGDMASADFERFLADFRQRHAWLSSEIALGYAHRYGTRADDLLAGANSPAALGRHFGGTLYEREARFLAREEWAREAADILERRTKHGLHLTAGQRASFESWFAGEGAAVAR